MTAREPAVDRSATAWLIEQKPPQGGSPSWFTAKNGCLFGTANQAIRFARKQDAEQFIRSWNNWLDVPQLIDVVVTEHAWIPLSDGTGGVSPMSVPAMETIGSDWDDTICTGDEPKEETVDRSEVRERIVDLLCEWVKDVPSKSDLTSSGDIADRILALPGIVPPAAAQDARLRRAALAVLAKWQEKGPFSPIGEMSALALALGHEQPAHERDDAAWAREAAPAPAAPAPYEINFDEVICPACCHQFRAIPVNVQRELNALRDMDEKAQGDEKLRRLKDEFALRGASIGFEDGYRLCCSHVVREVDDLLAETPAKPDVPPEPTCGQCRNWSPR